MKNDLYTTNESSKVPYVINTHKKLFFSYWNQIIKNNFNSELFDATREQDLNGGMDGWFYDLEGQKRTVGIRGRKWCDRNWNQFTVRYRGNYGHSSEWDKIVAGKTDYYIYYWYDTNKLVEYYLIDVNQMLFWGYFDSLEGWKPGKNDGGSDFYGYPFDELYKPLIIEKRNRNGYVYKGNN